MTEPYSDDSRLPEHLQTEMQDALRGAIAAYDAARMPFTNSEIVDFVKHRNPSLFERCAQALMHEKLGRVFQDLFIMFQVKGPKAFADMRRDVERKIVNHAFTEEEAAKMRVTVTCMKVVEGSQQPYEDRTRGRYRHRNLT
jgi:hypothetical protein